MDPSVILGQSCTAWPLSRQAKQVVLTLRSAIRLRRRFSEASLCSGGSLNEIGAREDRKGDGPCIVLLFTFFPFLLVLSLDFISVPPPSASPLSSPPSGLPVVIFAPALFRGPLFLFFFGGCSSAPRPSFVVSGPSEFAAAAFDLSTTSPTDRSASESAEPASL